MNQYGYISSATLNLSSGSQVDISGSSNTVSMAAGSTLAVTGDSNAITVAGTGASVTLGGSANTVSMSGGTLVLSGTDAPPGTGDVFGTRGFAFPSDATGEYGTAASAASMQALVATGANSIELVVTQYVQTVSDVNIEATTQTESDADLELAITQAQAEGVSVLLKPHIDIEDGTWRAYLAPGANIATFFANYQKFIVHYATIAQQCHVGMFSIGSELQSLTGAQYLPYWEQIIAAVRAVYSGPITYGSAWSETSSVSFWNLVDVIGAHPYENPTQIANPTVAQLDAGWNSVSTDPTEAADFTNQAGTEVSPVTFYQDLSAEYNKPILFTEIGYRSVNGATLLDGNYAGYSYEDFQQQTNALEAFFQTFSQYSSTWLQGAYVWDWNPDPTQVVTQDFSVQGKPAMNVVDSWYGSATSATAQTANFLTGNSNSVTVQDDHSLVLSGSSNILAVGNGASVQLAGSNNTVDFTGTASYATFIGGSGNVVSGNNETITVGSGAVVTVSGSGDTVIVASGGTLTGGSIVSGTEVVLNGGKAVGLHVSASTLQVSGGGIVSATTALAGGHVYISSGGIASQTTLLSGGTEIVLSGGTQAGSLIVASGGVASGSGGLFTGAATVSAGGSAVGLTLTNGTVTLIGGTATGLTITSGGTAGVVVSSGGTLSGGTLLAGTSANILAGGKAIGVLLSNAGLEISSGGIASSTTVRAGGHVDVFAGGSSIGTTVSSSRLEVSSGGYASAISIVSSGHLDVFAGGSALHVAVTSGSVTVAGATIDALNVSQGGSNGILISAGGIVSGGTVFSGTTANVLSGGSAAGLVVSGGALEVSGGAVVSNTTVAASGRLDISSGAIASTTTLGIGGQEFVSSGGIQTGLEVVSSGAILSGVGGLVTGNETILAGGLASNIAVSGATVTLTGGTAVGVLINNAGLEVSSGGIASGSTVLSGGHLDVSAGGITIGAILMSGSTETVLSGGTATTTTVMNGASATINGSGDTVFLSGGNATVTGAGDTISASGSGGSATISSGSFTVASGASVTLGGSGDTITVSGGATISALGSGNTIYATSASQVVFGGSAQGNVVYVSGQVAKSDDFVLGSTNNVHQLLSADLGSDTSADPSAVSGLESAANSADGIDQSPLEGAIWNTDTITVSLDGSATAFGHTLTDALDEWSEVSGKTFVVVDSSAHADISIGLANLDTSSTGLLGQTIYQADNGTFLPGIKIQLEDPAQLTFIGGSNRQMVYSGTNATFQQVALHEIGHALGLADSSDPHSIMYYGSGDQNRQLDATDLLNIASLYGEAKPFSQSLEGGQSRWSTASDTNADQHGYSSLSSKIHHSDQIHPTIPGGHWDTLFR